MPIQTSSITTETNGDLSLDPNGTGKVKLTDLAGTSTEQLAVDSAGNVEKLNAANLPEIPDTETGDLVVIQAGTSRGGVVAGDIYKIDARDISGPSSLDPSPSDVTAVPPFEGGSGTQGDPYIISPAAVPNAGGAAASVQLITVTSTRAGAVLVQDISSGDANGKFAQPPHAILTSGGSTSFNLVYNDTPATPIGQGQIYDGLMQLGATTVYFAWAVSQASNASTFGPTSAPTASPADVNFVADGKFGTVQTNWADGSVTLKNTDTNLVFSVNQGVLDSTNKAVINGDLVKVAFNTSAINAAAEGNTISGVLESTTGSYYSPFAIIKDTTPGQWTIPAVDDQATSAVVTSFGPAPDAYNCPTTVDSAVGGTTPLTNIEVSVGGGAFTSTFPVTINPGDLINVRGTTGAAADTTYSAIVTIGGVAATFSVTTGSTAAEVVTPQIVTPPNFGGVEQAPDVGITSSPIALVGGGAVTHVSSSWEAYKALPAAAPPVLSTDTITAATVTQVTPTLSGTGYSVSPAGAGAEVLFDGNGSTSVALGADGTFYTVTFSSSVKTTGQFRLMASNSGGSSSPSTSITISFNGGTPIATTAPPNNASLWSPVVSCPASLTTVTVTKISGTGITNMGMSFDGTTTQALLNPGAVLTLASSYGLSKFIPGNTVTQNASYKPVSSTITNVAESSTTFTPGGFVWVEGSGGGAFNAAYSFISSNSYIASADIGGSNVVAISIDFNPPVAFTSSLKIYMGLRSRPSGVQSYSYKLTGQAKADYTGDNILPSVGVVDVSGQGMTISGSGALESVSWDQAVSSANGGGYFYGLVVDGQKYFLESGTPVGGVAGFTALTLTNGTDLIFMEKGSVVQGIPNVPARAGSNTASYNDCTPEVLQTDTSINTSIYGVKWIKQADFAINSVTITWKSGNDLLITGYPNSNNLTGGTQLYTGTGSFTIDSSIASPYVRIYTAGPANGGSNFTFTSSDPLVSILDVNSTALSISTNGGTWLGSNGSGTAGGDTKVSVRSPLSQGTGTLSSVNTSTNQMVVSGVTSQFIPNTNGGSGTGVPVNFTATDPTITGVPVAPATEPPNSNYQLIEQDLNDTVNLTSWAPTAGFDSGSTNFVRVKYTDATPVTSSYSDWSGFDVATFLRPGEFTEGGYFAGQILVLAGEDDGALPSQDTLYNLILAPISTGQFGGSSPSTITWKTSRGSDTPTFTTENKVYGSPTTQLLNGTAYPMFNWVRNTVNSGTFDPTNAAGTGLSGFNDWYIAAYTEWAIIYYFLKPTQNSNFASPDPSPNTVDPYLPNTSYTTNVPGQTQSALFQVGGSEALTTTGQAAYWTASQFPTVTDVAYRINVTNGAMQVDANKDESLCFARAIRRVAAS